MTYCYSTKIGSMDNLKMAYKVFDENGLIMAYAMSATEAKRIVDALNKK